MGMREENKVKRALVRDPYGSLPPKKETNEESDSKSVRSKDNQYDSYFK
jgi:hypothetical protein